MWRKSSGNFRYFAIWNILGTYLLHDKSNKMTCSPSEYSDKPGNLPSLVPVVTVRMKKPWVLIATHWTHSEDSGQTGWMPCLIWVFAWCTNHFFLFCHASAQMVLMNTAIFSFSNTDKLCPIILNYALLKHLTCEDLFTVANCLW